MPAHTRLACRHHPTATMATKLRADDSESPSTAPTATSSPTDDGTDSVSSMLPRQIERADDMSSLGVRGRGPVSRAAVEALASTSVAGHVSGVPLGGVKPVLSTRSLIGMMSAPPRPCGLCNPEAPPTLVKCYSRRKSAALRVCFHESGPSRQDENYVTRFTNCKLVRGGKLIADDLWVFKGRIIDPATRFWDAHSSQVRVVSALPHGRVRACCSSEVADLLSLHCVHILPPVSCRALAGFTVLVCAAGVCGRPRHRLCWWHSSPGLD